MSGEEVLHWVRRNLTSHLPLIFLTARQHDRGIAAMLNTGADDYIVKSVFPVMILARVSALPRRAYRHLEPHRKPSGTLSLIRGAGRVLRNGASIDLTQREFSLALLLFRHMGHPLSRARICEESGSRLSTLL